MEQRIYSYTPRHVENLPRRRRRRGKRRRRVSPILYAVVFCVPIVVLLLVLSTALPKLFEQDTQPSFIATGDSNAAEPASPPVEEVGVYDFSLPVPVSAAVDESYFDDAVFIGDSRTEGLMLNTGLSNATFYAYKGLMVDTVFSKPVVNQDGQKRSVMDALKMTQFSKVYIMFGINETGWAYSQIFQTKYGELIDGIREINPEAVIYIQGILPVSNKVSTTHDYVTNEKINAYNTLLRELAQEKQAYYVDSENSVASGDGSLPAEAAVDGIHLTKPYCETWLDYLKTHTI